MRRDIGIDDAKELRNVLQPLADEALDAFLGTTSTSAKGQANISVSGVPLAVVSATSPGGSGSLRLPSLPFDAFLGTGVAPPACRS